MPWTGSPGSQTYTRSDGVRTGSTVCAQEASASTGIQASLVDAWENDMASALSLCLKVDGGTTATGNIPMGGNKLTGLEAGSTAGDSVEYSQWQAGQVVYIPSGTVMSFFQASAPTGWTQVTTYNDVLPRIVSGTGGGSYTSGNAFSTAAAGGTVGGTSITQAQLPNCNFTVGDSGHSHTIPIWGTTGGSVNRIQNQGLSGTQTNISDNSATTGITVSSGGSGSSHTHGFTGNSLNINYLNFILASKN